jgi:hypothetical protein
MSSGFTKGPGIAIGLFLGFIVGLITGHIVSGLLLGLLFGMLGKFEYDADHISRSDARLTNPGKVGTSDFTT